jgi:hypothetical protein
VVTCAGPGTYTWTVPDNVTQVTFDVFGAQGGCVANQQGLSGDLATCSGRLTNLPGKGGEAKATLSVHPHDMFQINVGGAGKDAPYPTDFLTSVPVGMGGFNGGGQAMSAGGGGGASDVLTGAFTLNDRVIVGGGGGGGTMNGGTFGGAGGGATGGTGSAFTCQVNENSPSCDTAQGRLTAGAGGTASAGGAAGAGDGQGGFGQPGGLGQGGNGNGGGGGGGGGWYGGGGGSVFGGGEGGGGGSGYVIPSATNSSLTGGVQAGDGRVTITYQAILPICPATGTPLSANDCPTAGTGFSPLTICFDSLGNPTAVSPSQTCAQAGLLATAPTTTPPAGLQGCGGSTGNVIPCNGGGPTAGPGTVAGNRPSGPQTCFDSFGNQVSCASGGGSQVCFDTFGGQTPCANTAGVGSPFGGEGNPFSPFGP